MNNIIAWLNARIDKVAHFGGGYIVATILPIPVSIGLLLTVIVAAWKEYRDKESGKGTQDIWDFIATVAGGILGYLAISLRLSLLGL